MENDLCYKCREHVSPFISVEAAYDRFRYYYCLDCVHILVIEDYQRIKKAHNDENS